MPCNVEIKARLPDRDRAISEAKELSGSEGDWLLSVFDEFSHARDAMYMSGVR